MSEGFEDAGRRIKAAVVSYLMRYKGVDRTLKEMGDEDPGRYWLDVAEKLVRGMNAEAVEQLFRPKKDSDNVVQRWHGGFLPPCHAPATPVGIG
jgi:hypothetical protein